MSFISFACHTRILTFFFFCMESTALFKLDPYPSPRYDVPPSHWNPQLLFWKQLNKAAGQQTIWKLRFPDSCWRLFSMHTNSRPKPIQNFPSPTHGYIYCTIYYLSTNQSNIFSFTCVSCSRLWTLQEANTELL